MELSSPLCSSSPGPVSAQAVAAGQVSSLKMVVQLLILPAGFGRFFPRWHMARKRTFIAESTSGNDPRRRTAAGPATSTVNPSCVNFSETDLRMRQVH